MHPKELYGYLGNLQARKGWNGPFTIKKICENKENMILDDVIWYAYVYFSEIKMMEYNVGEEEPVPKRFKGGR